MSSPTALQLWFARKPRWAQYLILVAASFLSGVPVAVLTAVALSADTSVVVALIAVVGFAVPVVLLHRNVPSPKSDSAS